MATTLVLDTNKLIKELKSSGFTEHQAAGITKALQSVDLSQLASKGDLRDMEIRLMKFGVTTATASVGIAVAVLAFLIQLLIGNGS